MRSRSRSRSRSRVRSRSPRRYSRSPPRRNRSRSPRSFRENEDRRRDTHYRRGSRSRSPDGRNGRYHDNRRDDRRRGEGSAGTPFEIPFNGSVARLDLDSLYSCCCYGCHCDIWRRCCCCCCCWILTVSLCESHNWIWKLGIEMISGGITIGCCQLCQILSPTCAQTLLKPFLFSPVKG